MSGDNYKGGERRSNPSLETSIAVMEQMLEQTLKAQQENTATTTELNANLSELVSEMKQRDIKDEYLKERFDTLEESVTLALPVINRSKLFQNRVDKFWETIFSKAGLVLISLIGLGILYVLGFDPAAVNIGK